MRRASATISDVTIFPGILKPAARAAYVGVAPGVWTLETVAGRRDRRLTPGVCVFLFGSGSALCASSAARPSRGTRPRRGRGSGSRVSVTPGRNTRIENRNPAATRPVSSGRLGPRLAPAKNDQIPAARVGSRWFLIDQCSANRQGKAVSEERCRVTRTSGEDPTFCRGRSWLESRIRPSRCQTLAILKRFWHLMKLQQLASELCEVISNL